jgi:hypothetical protein
MSAAAKAGPGTFPVYGTAASAAIGSQDIKRRLIQLLKRTFQFFSRRSQVLQQFHFVIEMNDECLILGWTQQVGQETVAC